jgi:hypothetical protein
MKTHLGPPLLGIPPVEIYALVTMKTHLGPPYGESPPPLGIPPVEIDTLVTMKRYVFNYSFVQGHVV